MKKEILTPSIDGLYKYIQVNIYRFLYWA